MGRFRQVLFAVVCTLGTVGSVHADTIAIQSYTGGVFVTSGNDQLYGWQFNVLSSIEVTSLGVTDLGSDGLAISHDVGIYRVSDQSLISSATVPSGTLGVLDAGVRYVSLAASLLLVPDSYVIVMTMPEINADYQWIQTSNVVTAPEIQYVTSAFSGSSTLAYPNIFGAFTEGIFGPNFRFNADVDATPVPEPTSLALAGMGMFGWAVSAVRRRRQQQSV